MIKKPTTEQLTKTRRSPVGIAANTGSAGASDQTTWACDLTIPCCGQTISSHGLTISLCVLAVRVDGRTGLIFSQTMCFLCLGGLTVWHRSLTADSWLGYIASRHLFPLPFLPQQGSRLDIIEQFISPLLLLLFSHLHKP
jgi:hypothetical protein